MEFSFTVLLTNSIITLSWNLQNKNSVRWIDKYKHFVKTMLPKKCIHEGFEPLNIHKLNI